MDTQLTFLPADKLKVQILEQEICPATFNDKDLPTDVHIVTYTVAGETYYDAVLPWNNYGWSKLGAESAVQMYKNSLIIRACMTEKPFIHKEAFSNVKCNFIYQDQFIKIFLKMIKHKGIINIGGKSQTIYKFAKKYKKDVKKKKSKGQLPLNIYMNLKKMNKLL